MACESRGVAPDVPDIRTRRCELLALAASDELRLLADDLIVEHGRPIVTTPPETGLAMMQVREPVARDRFHLGEVLVTRAEVDWHGATGWAMRIGTDRLAALAAAMCDAAAEIDPSSCERIDALCDAVAEREQQRSDREWAELLTTRVAFEELD